jgi:mutator protein MutT
MVEVAVALVFREGHVLVTCRPPGTHLAGFWEFPGGKIREGETPEACAEREVSEETGVLVRARARRPSVDWSYPERVVRIHPVDCDWISGEGEPKEVAKLCWARLSELRSLEFPPANHALIAELERAAR